MTGRIGAFDAVAEQGGVRCGITDDETDGWLAATDVMPVEAARRAALILQRAIHEAERGAENTAGQHGSGTS